MNIKENTTKDIVYLEDFSFESGILNYEGLSLEEILKKLKTFNPEAELKFHSPDGPPILFIYTYSPDTKFVLVKGEYDTDMASEIGVMFYDLQYHDDLTELDIYKELIECGIDVEMFRKYLGNHEANEMEIICKANGLL